MGKCCGGGGVLWLEDVMMGREKRGRTSTESLFVRSCGRSFRLQSSSIDIIRLVLQGSGRGDD